jgi:TnpA family transposase
MEDDGEHHWDDVLRMATSIRSGTATASAMLKKLSGYPRQNGLAIALPDIGRVERSLFMLGSFSDPELRRRTGLGLNKGEARNFIVAARSEDETETRAGKSTGRASAEGHPASDASAVFG